MAKRVPQVSLHGSYKSLQKAEARQKAVKAEYPKRTVSITSKNGRHTVVSRA